MLILSFKVVMLPNMIIYLLLKNNYFLVALVLKQQLKMLEITHSTFS